MKTTMQRYQVRRGKVHVGYTSATLWEWQAAIALCDGLALSKKTTTATTAPITCKRCLAKLDELADIAKHAREEAAQCQSK